MSVLISSGVREGIQPVQKDYVVGLSERLMMKEPAVSPVMSLQNHDMSRETITNVQDEFCRMLSELEFGPDLHGNIMKVSKLLTSFQIPDTREKAFRTFDEQKDAVGAAMLNAEEDMWEILNGMLIVLNNTEYEIKKWMQEIMLADPQENQQEW